MTVKELAALIGQEVQLSVEDIVVAVRILDAKTSYGQSRVLVTPLAGRGEQWVSITRITQETRIL